MKFRDTMTCGMFFSQKSSGFQCPFPEINRSFTIFLIYWRKNLNKNLMESRKKNFESLVEIEDKCEYLIYQAFWYQFLPLS